MRDQEEWNRREKRGEGIMYANARGRMRWLPLGPGSPDQTDDFFDRMIDKAAQEQWVLIGQWYYYLYAHEGGIDLCRTRGGKGMPSLTEVISPYQYAITDDDLEYAVHYWTCGTFEPGHYRISPLIERKLRILFE